MFVSLLPRNLCEVYRIMVAQTFLLRAGGWPPSLENRYHCLHLARQGCGDAHTFFFPYLVTPLAFQAGALLMKPGTSCSPFAVFSTTLVGEHPPHLPLSGQPPDSSSLHSRWCLSTVGLCLGPFVSGSLWWGASRVLSSRGRKEF